MKTEQRNRHKQIVRSLLPIHSVGETASILGISQRAVYRAERRAIRKITIQMERFVRTLSSALPEEKLHFN
jgi:hypothetical protein